ncbi:hypothetical protein D910_02325 [Dendroctonus ponderosae]|uniref:G-protein coupled receptors family 1 profile domain-containing protein n=1 Tax=Dendroctonus ponderosae TaxID=77166 RepID=U4TVV5_DENPD|nr:hypothetical protein D910_02325 [Dendroctonus ponderosae]
MLTIALDGNISQFVIPSDEPKPVLSAANNDTFMERDISDQDTVTMMSILLVGVFLSLLIFLSVAGNILVCIAIYTDRGLRRIGNLFLASLAIADLFVASLVMTFAGVNDLLGYWIFGSKFCDTWIAFDVMCSTASILNLCAISLDRYIHIKDPLSCCKIDTQSHWRHCTILILITFSTDWRYMNRSVQATN